LQHRRAVLIALVVGIGPLGKARQSSYEAYKGMS